MQQVGLLGLGGQACCRATALYIDSIKQGVTTIFDHHASYGEIPGTLHTIAEESKRLGLRSCLCYEVSDRDGEEKCLQAIKENADWITYCSCSSSGLSSLSWKSQGYCVQPSSFRTPISANIIGLLKCL